MRNGTEKERRINIIIKKTEREENKKLREKSEIFLAILHVNFNPIVMDQLSHSLADPMYMRLVVP